MAKIGETELKLQIKNNDLSSVYMLYGEEGYLKEHYTSQLKKAVIDPAFADFNYHEYDGKAVPLADILHDAEMMPMMAERTFILAHDYPLDKSKDDVETLKEFFKDIPDTCVIVFWFDNIDVDVKKSSRWNTIINAIAKAGSAVDLQKRTESDLVKLIASFVKKRNCTITSDNARYLISVVGSDLKTIFNELEKICGFASNGEITKQIIDELATKCLQARVYDLSKHILSGNSDMAYSVLNTLFAQKEEHIPILSVISSCYIDMYRVKCAKSAGVNENELSKYFNYKGREWLIRNAVRDCRNISVESLRLAIDVLSQADEMLKSTSIDKNLLLEETIAKLLMLRNK